VADVGAQVVIDRDGSRAGIDPGGVKIKVLEVGGPADGSEHGLGRRVLDRAAGDEADGDLAAAAPRAWTLAPVVTFMPLASNAWLSAAEMPASAPGTIRGPASTSRTSAPKSAKIEAIWQPVSAPPMTATSCGRALRVKMSW
jgi:hypothetical protein